jgi:hypothetical protein
MNSEPHPSCKGAVVVQKGSREGIRSGRVPVADPADAGSSAAADKSKVAKNRPAETLTAAGALGVLVAQFLGLDDPEILTALIVLIGVLPAGITWLVELSRKWEGPSSAAALTSAELPYIRQRALRKSRVGDSSWRREFEAAKSILELQTAKGGTKEKDQAQTQKPPTPKQHVVDRKTPEPKSPPEMSKDLIRDPGMENILETSSKTSP